MSMIVRRHFTVLVKLAHRISISGRLVTHCVTSRPEIDICAALDLLIRLPTLTEGIYIISAPMYLQTTISRQLAACRVTSRPEIDIRATPKLLTSKTSS